MRLIWIFPLTVLLLSACQSDTEMDQPGDMAPADTATTAAPASSHAADLVDIDFNPNLAGYIKTLASDEFAGRQPATVGEEKTLDFLVERFRAAGMQPGMGESFLQPVPLVAITAEDASDLVIETGDQSQTLRSYDQVLTWTSRQQQSIAIDHSEVVFVGYGIVAPEYDWNDYAGVDVRGKTVVIMVNDPGFVNQDSDLFRGRAMTYYGRWTYKYEEAARQGAAMALVIHQTDAAGYGFHVLQAGARGAQYHLDEGGNEQPALAIEGWLNESAAQQLFSVANADWQDLTQAAGKPGFAARPLGVTASVSLKNRFERLQSHNVVAVYPGSERPDEYFIYTAHWDHLGTDPSLEGDTIYNGAQDNASGTAALLALAENFAAAPRPQRSIAFVAVTAEESGLLGSRYFGLNPPFPVSQIAGGLNMDALNIAGPMRDLIVIGHGSSELEPIIAQLAERQNRYIVPDLAPEKGFYYRSDHFNLAKLGVPMLYVKGGTDHFEHGQEYGRERSGDYLKLRYHKPADEFGPWWDMRGVEQDLSLYFQLGMQVANSSDWPEWYEGNEFRAIREASRTSE
ncbi:MAG: M28 family metallopeptidase [Wenzhouxiangellaceae bacterium]